LNYPPDLLEEWLIGCKGATIELDHSGAPAPFGDGFDPCILGEGSLNEFDLEDELTEAISKQYGVKESRIALTFGAQNSNYLFIHACVEGGKKVAIEMPTYTPIFAVAGALHGKPMVFRRTRAHDFTIPIDNVKKLMGRGAGAIAITNIHNPSAKQLSDDELRELLEVAAKKDLMVLCDETFREMSYVKPSSAVCRIADNGISTCGTSKLWGLGGLRVGWLIGPEEVAEKVIAAREYSSGHPAVRSMSVAIRAISKKKWFRDRALRIARENIPVLKDWLLEEKRLRVKFPDGALMFLAQLPKGVDDVEFATRLFKGYNTAVCPGTYFGAKGSIRVTFSCARGDFEVGLRQISSILDMML
jgi:aspartate/methionine/tyrosine aminotransferase